MSRSGSLVEVVEAVVIGSCGSSVSNSCGGGSSRSIINSLIKVSSSSHGS